MSPEEIDGESFDSYVRSLRDGVAGFERYIWLKKLKKGNFEDH